MTEAQADKIIKELKSIRLLLTAGILVAAVAWASHQVTQAIIGPPPPPTVSVQPPK